MRQTNSPLYRRCGAEEETSFHVLCECEALASLRHAYLGFFFLDREDVSLGHSGTLVQEQGCYGLASDYGAQRARPKAKVYRDCKGSNAITILFYSMVGFHMF
jgi:hypothetical protein